MKTLISFCAILLLCSSCFSKLKVTVEIADHDKVKEQYQKVKQTTLAELVAYQEFLSEIRPEKLSKILTDKINGSGGSQLDPNTYQRGKSIIESKIKTLLNPDFEAVDKYLKEASTTENKNLDTTLIRVKYHTNSIVTKIRQYGNEIQMDTDIDDLLKAGYLSYKKTVSIKESTLRSIERTRFPLLGDPLASYIVKGENGQVDGVSNSNEVHEFWVGEFNVTKSINFLGNSDIAVILRSSPQEEEIKSGDYNNNFTIKGVRLDASDFANAFINTMTQTISFVAQTQGIPIPKATVANSNDPVNPVQSPEALALSSRRNQLQELEENSKKVRQLVLQKILEQDIRSLNEDELNQHIANITSYWNNLKPMLNKSNNGTTALQD